MIRSAGVLLYFLDFLIPNDMWFFQHPIRFRNSNLCFWIEYQNAESILQNYQQNIYTIQTYRFLSIYQIDSFLVIGQYINSYSS